MTAVYTKYFYKSDVTFQACEHNTNGMKCDYCVAGYYGDATQGAALDCQQCACPLVESSNNFSPNLSSSCQIAAPLTISAQNAHRDMMETTAKGTSSVLVL